VNQPAMRLWVNLIALLALSLTVPGPPLVGAEEIRGFAPSEPLAPLPATPPLDRDRVALGGRLFHDTIMSRRQTLSCSSCHDLSIGGTVPLKRTIGYDGRMHAFNAPTIFNVGHNYRLGWRGKFTSLALQNERVLIDPNLMANEWGILLPRLSRHHYYGAEFKRVYGNVPDRESVLDALVSFQRSLTTPNAPFDLFLQGDTNAISAQQKHGYELFKGYGCMSCHQGAHIGGNMFQIFGVFADPETDRLSATLSPEWPLNDIAQDQEAFRVPSLRNVAVTAPYFHDGRAETLREAVAIMGRSQLGREIADTEIDAITAFLESLTGEYNGKRLQTSNGEDRR